MRFLVACLTAGLCMLGPVQHAWAQDGLTRPQAREVAQQLLAAGQPVLVIDITNALLSADSADVQALLLQSRAYRALGKPEKAATAGKKAYQAAQSQDARFVAAMSVAEARANQNKLTASQLWLRRAEQNAPTEKVRARVVNDFKFVRSNNPWNVDLRFDVRPSDNVNNGTTSEGMVFNLFGQDFFFATPVSALPLSGTEISYGTTITYRPQGIANRPLSFSLDLDGREIRLSSEAKEINPAAENSDFAFQQLAFGAKYDLVSSPDSTLATGITLGRNWYASSHLTDFYRFQLSGAALVTEHAILGGALEYDRQVRMDSQLRSSTTWTMRGYHSTLLSNGDRFTLSGSLAKSNAKSADFDFRSASIGARYSLGKPVLGATLDFNINYSAKNFDRPLYSTDPRKDKTTRIGASLFFKDTSYLGFAPIVSLSASRTESNVARFDTEEIGISIGLRSAF